MAFALIMAFIYAHLAGVNATLTAPTAVQAVPELGNPIVQAKIASSPLLQAKMATFQSEMTAAYAKVASVLLTRLG